MVKIAITPSTAGYSVGTGGDVVSQHLDGGKPKLRRDVLGAVRPVNVQWFVGVGGFQYLQTFFHGTTQGGSLPFEIDLIMDQPTLTEHQATFVPNSFELVGVKGLRHEVVASLYAVPIPRDADFDAAFAELYAIYGEGLGPLLNILEDTANQDVWGP